jgi:hypothetical protein
MNPRDVSCDASTHKSGEGRLTEILWLDLYPLLLDNNIFVNLMRPGESDYSHVAGHVFDGLTI